MTTDIQVHYPIAAKFSIESYPFSNHCHKVDLRHQYICNLILLLSHNTCTFFVHLSLLSPHFLRDTMNLNHAVNYFFISLTLVEFCPVSYLILSTKFHISLVPWRWLVMSIDPKMLCFKCSSYLIPAIEAELSCSSSYCHIVVWN